MNAMRLAALGWFLSAPVLAGVWDDVALSAEQQARLGLQVAPVVAMQYAAQAEGSGQAVELTPLLGLNAELSAAEAQAAALHSAYRRVQGLHAEHADASTAELESARAQWQVAQAQVEGLRQQLRLQAGAAVAAMAGPSRQRLFQRLSQAQAVLVRADFPPGTQLPALRDAEVLGLDRTPLGRARVQGPTLAVSALQPGPGLWLLLENAQGVRPGQPLQVRATLAGKSRAGVRVPNAALLYREGATWCYVRVEPGRFERRRLPSSESIDGGVFVADALKPGALVVVQGAASLLAVESAGANAGTADEDD